MRALLLLLAAGNALPEILDRVAISIERQIITETDIQREIRVVAFLNGVEPSFTAENKRNTADKLVEQSLIRREIETSRYMAAQTEAPRGYQQFRQARFPNEANYAQALTQAGIQDSDVRQAFEWQRTLLDFIEVRFRPGILIPESEIRDYYEGDLTIEAKTKNQPLPSFDDSRQSIEAVLLARRVDNALDRWLGQVRTQVHIRYREEVFK